LIALLAQLPGDIEVTTWDERLQEQHAVEQVITITGRAGSALVLGMEMTAGWMVDGAEVVWTAHDTARKGLKNLKERVG
jgi:hypothetical protein